MAWGSDDDEAEKRHAQSTLLQLPAVEQARLSWRDVGRTIPDDTLDMAAWDGLREQCEQAGLAPIEALRRFQVL